MASEMTTTTLEGGEAPGGASGGKPRPVRAGVLYTLGFSMWVTRMAVLAFVLSLAGNVVLFALLNARARAVPWVVETQADGSRVSLGLRQYSVTPEHVFAYLSYVIPRLYLVSEGRQAGLESLRHLVDDRVLAKEEQAFRQYGSEARNQGMSWQAQTMRLLMGTPDRRSFAISRRLGMARASVEGRTILITSKLNRSEAVRWDVDLEVVAPSSINVWGLRLVGIQVRGLEDAPLDLGGWGS